MSLQMSNDGIHHQVQPANFCHNWNAAVVTSASTGSSQYYSSPCRQLSTPANHKLEGFVQSTRSAVVKILN